MVNARASFSVVRERLVASVQRVPRRASRAFRGMDALIIERKMDALGAGHFFAFFSLFLRPVSLFLSLSPFFLPFSKSAIALARYEK